MSESESESKRYRIIESDSDIDEEDNYVLHNIDLILDIINDNNFHSSSKSNSLKLADRGTHVRLSNFNLMTKPNNKNLDTRGYVTKFLNSKLVPGLLGIIDEYRKPGQDFSELLEEWNNTRFPSTNFRLILESGTQVPRTASVSELNEESILVISEFNYIKWQYYFNVNNVVYYGRRSQRGPNVYIIKAGTKLFIPVKNIKGSNQMEKPNDYDNFFFTPEMAEFSIINDLGSYYEIGRYKEIYQDYHINQYTVRKDIRLIFHHDDSSMKLPNIFNFDGYLLLRKFKTSNMSYFEDMNKANSEKWINATVSFKMEKTNITNIYNLTRHDNESVYLPDLIIKDINDSLTFVTFI